ncbi:MAG: ATP synthase F1 subunit gamma [Proteobacteria bacterium]|nr:ATP synthase F1 subunit gamma [Pseudomonadota bacterium]
MANLKDIKKRIGSLKNTSQITKAMKMVSAAKLRRAQVSIVAARPYAEKMQALLASLSEGAESLNHPLLEVRASKKVAVILFTSDRGLCGGFNANLIKKAEAFSAESCTGKDRTMLFYGKKGRDHFNRRNAEIAGFYQASVDKSGYALAKEISDDIIAAYTAGDYDEVYLVSGHFKSAMTQIPTVEKLLPVVPEEGKESPETVDVIYEPDPEAILEGLIPKYISSQIYKAILETAASEHGARMSAMDSASKNASEMIGNLTVQYNRARQAAITTELMDIINGAQAV